MRERLWLFQGHRAAEDRYDGYYGVQIYPFMRCDSRKPRHGYNRTSGDGEDVFFMAKPGQGCGPIMPDCEVRTERGK